MSCSNPSNYQNLVNKHSKHGGGGLGIDFDEAKSSNLSKMIEDATDSPNDTNIKTLEIEIDVVEHCDAAAANARIYKGFGGIAVSPKKAGFLLAALVLLGTGGIIGFGLSGVVEHKRQQQHRRMDTLSYRLREHDVSTAGAKVKANAGGKAGKVCMNDHDPIDGEEEFCKYSDVVCGDSFTNQDIVLSGDIFCTDNVELATDADLVALNAAVTLTGPNASIDCKGHSIRQMVRGVHASGCSYGAGSYSSDNTARKEMKEECGLYYQVGIMLLDGATAKNCRVDEFYDGFIIIDGGEVEKSEVSETRTGVFVQDMTGARETTVSDVYTHHNAAGIIVANDAVSNAVAISDVTSTLNIFQGVFLVGPVITVKDSAFSHNGYAGIVAGGGPHDTVNLHFEGTVSSHHNANYGVDFFYMSGGSPKTADITINGVVNTYLNGMIGLHIQNDSMFSLQITLRGGKSKWNSCQNSQMDFNGAIPELDIFNAGEGGVNFVDEGTGGYTCDTSDEWIPGSGLPVCVACPTCI